MIPYCILVIEDDNDRTFMENLYLDFHRLIYSEVGKVIKNQWDAEDVMQIVLVKLIGKISTLRSLPRSRLVNYIISTCKYTAYNYVRDQNGRKESPFEDYIELPSNDHNRHYIEDALMIAEELDCLTRIWPQFDDRTRFLLEGYYILEKPMLELAADLGIRPESVRMALTRARKKAFELFTEDFNTETTQGTQ